MELAAMDRGPGPRVGKWRKGCTRKGFDSCELTHQAKEDKIVFGVATQLSEEVGKKTFWMPVI